MSSTSTIGPTGEYPHGRISDDDEGGLRAAIEARGGRVNVHFGKSLAWFSMTPEEARAFAKVINQLSYQAESKQ